MSKLIVANVDSEHQVADVSGYTADERSEILLCNYRMVWLAEEGDIVVLPKLPEPEIVAYWAELFDVPLAKQPTFIAPEDAGDETAFLRQERMFSSDFIAKCRTLISNLSEQERPSAIRAYYPDNYVAEFCEKIGLAVQDGFLKEGGATLLNQKTTFRKMASGIGVPIPEGRICDNDNDLRRAMIDFIEQGADFIVKLDRHSGGFGNVIVLGPNSKSNRYGSSSVLSYVSREEGLDICESIVPKVTEAAVVERYADTDTVLYSEYHINGPGNFQYLNDGTMDMKPLWVGFEIPGQYPNHVRTQFLDQSARIVAAASQLGYRGFINVDGLAVGSKSLVNEINGRCGGCTHIFDIARRLFGNDVLAKKHIKSYNHGVIWHTNRLVEDLRDNNLLLEKGGTRGVIPLTIDYDQSVFEYMTIADTYAEAVRLHGDLKLLGQQIGASSGYAVA